MGYDKNEEQEFGEDELEELSELQEAEMSEETEQVNCEKDILQESARVRNEQENNPWYCVWISDAKENKLIQIANSIDGGGKVQLWKPCSKEKGKKIYLYEGYCFIRCTDSEAREFQRKNNALNIKVVTVLRKMDGKTLCKINKDEIEQIKIVEGTYSISDEYGINVGDRVTIGIGIFGGTEVIVKEINNQDVKVEFDAWGRHQKLWVNIKELIIK